MYGGGSNGIAMVLATPLGFVNDTGLEGGDEAVSGDDVPCAAPVPPLCYFLDLAYRQM